MKNIFVLLPIFILLTNCKVKNQAMSIVENGKNGNDSIIELGSYSQIIEPKQQKDFSFLDTIETVALPKGNELLIDFTFPKSWDFGSPYDSKRTITDDEKRINELLGFGDNYTVDSFNSSGTHQQNLDYFLDSETDYRNSSVDFKSTFDYGLSRFPVNNDSIKVISLCFSKDSIYPNEEFPFSVSYCDVLTIKDDKIIDDLVLNRFEGNYSLGGFYRLSHIDKNFIIHLKDFNYGENQGYFIRYDKWKVKNNGRFVRYYNQKDTLLTQGKVINHLREGNWTEIYSDPNLAFKNKFSSIEVTSSFSEGKYVEGEKDEEWRYYENEGNKKGKLLYTELYEDGELRKRTFIE